MRTPLDFNQQLVDQNGKATSYFEDYLYEDSDVDWIGATLTNSWGNAGSPYANAGFRLENGIVYMQGVVSGGTITPETVIFTMDDRYWPSERLSFSTVSGGAFASFDVLPNGEVRIMAGSNTSFSLQCSYFIS